MTSGISTTRGRRARNRLPRLPVLSGLLIMAAVGLFLRELIIFSQAEDRLPLGISVAGIDVGGMRPAEAVAAWEQAYAQPVTLYYNDSPILLDPASVGFRINQQAMLAEAINVGESTGSFWIRFFNHLTQQEFQRSAELALNADFQQSLLEQFLQDISHRYDQPPGPPGYDVQTLTTFAGSPGFVLDVEQSIELIDAALHDPEDRTVTLPVGGADANRPALDTLRELIVAYLDAQGFIYDGQTTVASVFILDLQTGEEINLLGDVAFTAASTSKVAILIDYYRYLTNEPTQEEAWLMANSLLCSQNSSSNLLMQIIGGGQDVFAGIARVTETTQYLGARNTFISAPFDEGVEGQQLGSIAAPATNPNPNYNTDPDPFNQTTAEDMATLFSLIYDCEKYGSGLMTAYPNGEFSRHECRQMLELTSGNDLLRLLQGGIPPDVRISHKNGWINDMVGDAGIVYPPNGRDYVISVFLWEQAEFQNYERLWPLVEGISRAAWNYFSPDMALHSRREDLPAAAQECEGNYLPPDAASVNLDDIDAWRSP